MKLSGTQVSDLFTVAPAAQVLVAGEHADPARLRKPRGRLGEIRAHLLARRPLVEPRVLAGQVDAILAKHQRVHAVVRRGGMQADERIRMQPMTSRGITAVDHGHLGIRLGHQRVDEGQPARARPYNQIIGVHKQFSPPRIRATSPTLTRLR
jgi:hypothetical protein